MGLFSRRPSQLPTTSYGYAPPPEATAKGYICLDRDNCGNVVIGAVRTWPKMCDKCGGRTDPRFDDPWDHDSDGYYLPYKIEQGKDGGLFEDLYLAWRYKDALMKRDSAAAAAAKRDAQLRTRAAVATGDWYPPPLCYWIGWHALEFGQIDDAADELTLWVTFVSTENVETDNKNRTNVRQFIDAAIRFLQDSRGKAHHDAPRLTAQMLSFASKSRAVLTSDNVAGLRSLGLT